MLEMQNPWYVKSFIYQTLDMPNPWYLGPDQTVNIQDQWHATLRDPKLFYMKVIWYAYFRPSKRPKFYIDRILGEQSCCQKLRKFGQNVNRDKMT